METAQERRLHVTNSFDTTIFNFGTANPDEKVPFEFNYTGEIPIFGVTAACNCTELKVEAGVIKGLLSLSNANYYNTQAAQYVQDENGVFWTVAGGWATPSDPRLQRVPAIQVKGKKIPQEKKTITVVFDDGQPRETVNENGVIVKNADKTELQLTITGFINL